MKNKKLMLLLIYKIHLEIRYTTLVNSRKKYLVDFTMMRNSRDRHDL